uniref:Protein kinase domain-containing protein n=1 Tax=Ditylenchus dipsaci TaxID=166011 RepID=A0A915EQ11_9BILA
MIDFGLSTIGGESRKDQGTQGYKSPEIINNMNYSYEADCEKWFTAKHHELNEFFEYFSKPIIFTDWSDKRQIPDVSQFVLTQLKDT